MRTDWMLALALLVATGPSVVPAPAHAKIVCRDGYQTVGGSQIATPYCQDELLARVARDHGMKASSARIRDNPNYKREVCRFVGHDIRVSQHCQNETPSFRGRAF